MTMSVNIEKQLVVDASSNKRRLGLNHVIEHCSFPPVPLRFIRQAANHPALSRFTNIYSNWKSNSETQ